MKIGLLFDSRNENYLFFGHSTLSLKDAFIADVDVPEEIEYAVRMTKHVWSRDSDYPQFHIDPGNHGFDRGLVLTKGYCDSVEPQDPNLDEFIRKELRVRISFGRTNSREDTSQRYCRTLGFNHLDRIHLSVYGGRNFFPKGVADDDATPLLEEAHVSLRWLKQDGEWVYDDWNDVGEWIREAGNPRSGHKRFSETRTTYCFSERGKLSVKNSTGNSSTDLALKFIESEGRRGAVFGLQKPRLEDLHPDVEGLRKVFPEGRDGSGVESGLPLAVGYENVAGVLKGLIPDVKDSWIRCLPPKSGVVLLYGSVLHGMERFIES